MFNVFTCPICYRVKILRKVTQLQDVQCTCEAVFRIQITQLHDGKPQDYATREAALAYTYDLNGNRITLSDMRRQTATVHELRSGVDSAAPNGGTQSGNSK